MTDGQGVSVVCEMGFGIYAAKPIVDELKRRGVNVYVYTQEANVGKAVSYLGVKEDHVVSIQSITNKTCSVIDYLLKQLLMKSDFSTQHSRIVKGRKGILGLLGKLLRILPKPRQNRVNTIYAYIWKNVLLKSYFRTSKVIYFTSSNNTYFLNSKQHNVFVVVESWDHPAKSPFFVIPEMVFTWNEALIKDIHDFQGSTNCMIIYPLKFRYIEEMKEGKKVISKNSIYNDDMKWIRNNSYILYICTYSSFSGPDYFSKELWLIVQLAGMCEKLGKKLYVRPHPHFKGDEFASIDDKKMIRVGQPASKPGFNCLFTVDDQIFKTKLLRQAEMILNVGTTLVLEASLTNQNILQLDLAVPDFEGFARASQNYHIRNHLNTLPSVVHLTVSSISVLEDYLQNGVSNEFSLALREWIMQSKSLKHSVTEIVNVVLGNTGISSR